MQGERMLSDIRDRLRQKNVHELWDIAKIVGVSSPSVLKKNELIDVTMAIISGKRPPDPQTQRGAPRKESAYDSLLVADIEDCINYFAALKEGTRVVGEGVLSVSDRSESRACAGLFTRGERHCFLRVAGALSSPDDVFVAESFVTRFSLREGDFIEGECRRRTDDEAPGLTAITRINGAAPDLLKRADFERLTPIYPSTKLNLGASSENIALKMTDLFAPMGLGQRAAISGAVNTGKSTLLKSIGAGISLNQRDLKIILLLLSERPEEVTEAKRTVTDAELYYTTFDMPREKHALAAKLISEHCKRRVEEGENVVLLVDGISSLDGEEAKKLLACAKNAEEGGSLTVIYTAEGELVSAANACVTLSEKLAAEGVYPAIDVTKTYTRKSELLQSDEARAAAENIKKSLTPPNIVELFKNYGVNDIINRYKNG